MREQDLLVAFLPLFLLQLPLFIVVFLSLQFQSAFESKEAYYKDIRHREDGGKLESVTDYLKRLESYMKLYGALVQVCHSL
jgi:nucleoporin GLE1